MGAGCIKESVVVVAATPVVFIVGTSAALGAATAATLRGARSLVGSDAGKNSMNDKRFRDRILSETNALNKQVKEKEKIESEWNRKQRGEIETEQDRKDFQALARVRHRRESFNKEQRAATRQCHLCGEKGPGPFPGTCMCPVKCHSCGFYGPPRQCHCPHEEAREKHRYEKGAAVSSGRMSSRRDNHGAHSGSYKSRSVELQSVPMAPPPPPVVNFARAGSLGKLSSSSYKHDMGFGGLGHLNQLEAALGKPKVTLHVKLA